MPITVISCPNLTFYGNDGFRAEIQQPANVSTGSFERDRFTFFLEESTYLNKLGEAKIRHARSGCPDNPTTETV